MGQAYQEARYILAPRQSRRPAAHVRSRRIGLICLALLIYIPAVILSINALISGEHWWGLGAQPTNTPSGAWQITWIDGSGAASNYDLQPGNLILTVDGHPPHSEDEINHADTLVISDRPQHIIWQAPSQADDLLSISWIVIGAVSILLGLLIFLHATDRTLASRFFLLWTAVGIAFSLEPASNYGNLLAIHASVILSIGVGVGLLANFLWLLLFPSSPTSSPVFSGGQRSTVEGAKHSSGHRWLPETPIITGTLIGAFYLVAVLLKRQDMDNLAGVLTYAQSGLAICLSLLFILRVSLSRRATIARERGRTLLGGMILGLTPLLALEIIPGLISGQELVPGPISALAIIALPLSFGYAIVRRDLLRVDSLIRNTALVLLTIIGMAIGSLLLAGLLAPLPNIPALVIGILAGAVLAPFVLAGARWLTETWLFPQVKRYRKLIEAGESVERTGLDPERIAGQLIGEVHLAMPVRQVAVFVVDKQSGQLLALPAPRAKDTSGEHLAVSQTSKGGGSPTPLPQAALPYEPLWLDEAVSIRLSRGNAPLLVEPAPDGQVGYDSTAEERLGAEQPDLEHWHALLPMRVRGRLVGVLALSRREDGQSYADTDLRLLRFLANRRALALDYSLLYADLHTAYEQRRELDAAKDRFIVTAHHELRTPLTGVLGYLELLNDLGVEGRQVRPKEVEIFVERALGQAGELAEQLDSLLKAAEVTFSQSEFRPQEVFANATAQRAIQTLNAQARRDNHRVHNQIPSDLVVIADQEALYRIFMNLLSNAIKYSLPGKPIVFDIWQEQRKRVVTWASPPIPAEGTSELLVRDWGNGIAPKRQPFIFERFYRQDQDLNSPVRGSGLGLAICHELITGMGGSIGVESAGIPGNGSTFFIRLPLASAAPSDGTQVQQQPPVLQFQNQEW